jgi:hypothetical protein
MKVRGFPGPGSPRCTVESSDEISNVVDTRGTILTCLISSGYRVILCTVMNVQREPGDNVRINYLEREGNLKGRGFGRQGLLEGAEIMSALDMYCSGGPHVEVSSKLWIPHPQSLQKLDSGSFVDTVFLSVV